MKSKCYIFYIILVLFIYIHTYACIYMCMLCMYIILYLIWSNKFIDLLMHWLTLTQFVSHNCDKSMHFAQCCSYDSCCIFLGVSRGQSQSQSPQEQHDRSQSSRQFGHFDAVLSANSTRRSSTHSLASSCQAEWETVEKKDRARGRSRKLVNKRQRQRQRRSLLP